MKRNLSVYVTIVIVIIFAVAANAASPVFPKIISLPNGFWPEGIVVGKGTDFFVGSLVDGAIYAGDLLTGQGGVLVPGQMGRMAVGLSFDPRSSFLFVCGGYNGDAFVYDTSTGAEVAAYLLSGPGGMINDVIVTADAAYFTDSFNPVLYRLPLDPAGSLPDQADVEAIPLGGDFQHVPGEFNANGIEATPDGKWLLIINSYTGLYKVDPESGDAIMILDADTVPSGDGIVLTGKILYVVQNFLNQIAVVELDPDLTSGAIVNVITDPYFRIPATASDFGSALYAVNARFDVPPGPDVEYEVVRVEIKGKSKAAPALNYKPGVTNVWGRIKSSR
jgi:hypothetical protein